MGFRESFPFRPCVQPQVKVLPSALLESSPRIRLRFDRPCFRLNLQPVTDVCARQPFQRAITAFEPRAGRSTSRPMKSARIIPRSAEARQIGELYHYFELYHYLWGLLSLNTEKSEAGRHGVLVPLRDSVPHSPRGPLRAVRCAHCRFATFPTKRCAFLRRMCSASQTPSSVCICPRKAQGVFSAPALCPPCGQDLKNEATLKSH